MGWVDPTVYVVQLRPYHLVHCDMARALGETMSGRVRRAVLACAIAAVVAGCVPDPPPPADGSAPLTISGTGNYEFELRFQGDPALSGAYPAVFDLVRAGSTYSGTVVAADNSQQTYVEFAFAGNQLTSMYTRDGAASQGQGFEFHSATLTTSRDSSGTICTGDGLRIASTGPLTIDGAPSDYSASGVWTICDAAAVGYFTTP